MASQSGGGYNDDTPNTDQTALKSGPPASESPSVESAATSDKMHVEVHRPVYTQMEFNETYNFVIENKLDNTKQILRGLAYKHCAPSGLCIKKLLLSLFPFIGIMSQYNVRRDLFSDIIAGLTVGIMHIPQG